MISPFHLRKVFFLVLCFFLGFGQASALSVSTVAGHIYRETDDGFLPAVGLDVAGESLEDQRGNLYVVDKNQNLIFVIDRTGYKTTFAGTGIAGLDDGERLKASFKKPHGIVQDSLGNFYISDTDNNVIRKIATDGYVSTFAGSGSSGFADGHGDQASFYTPMGLAIDADDNIYVADQRNHLIRKIDSAANVTTLAGTARRAGLVDGQTAKFNYPEAVALDDSGNVYVADKTNNLVRKINSAGLVSTFAGCGENCVEEEIEEEEPEIETPQEETNQENNGNSGNNNGNGNNGNGNSGNNGHGKRSARRTNAVTALRLELNQPSDLQFDQQGNLYIVDRGSNSIKKIDTQGLASTLLGSQSGFWDASSNSHGDSFFNAPYAININQSNELLVSDLTNKKIRKINLSATTPSYKVDTLIGNGSASSVDGLYNVASIKSPQGLAYDQSGNLYFSEPNNHLIRKLNLDGTVVTVAGTGTRGFTDGSGLAATLNKPYGLVVNSQGEIYFADRDNHAIRKIDLSGNVVTVSGSGRQGYTDGPAVNAQFNLPTGLAIDANDNIYIADTNNHMIRKLSADGTVTTVSGTRRGDSGGNINFARFNSPTNVAVDASGNIYVADQGNHKIRKIAADGLVTTIAGIGDGYQDGKGRYALFSKPAGLAVSSSGLLYIADSANNRIRIIDLTTGLVKTLVGSGIPGYKDGDDDLVSFNAPSEMIIDADGNLVLSDSSNHRIRKIDTSLRAASNVSTINKKFFVSTIAGNGSFDLVDGLARYSSFKTPTDVTQDSQGNIFIVDKSNHVVRKIDTDGEVSVFAGTGVAGYADGEGYQAQFSSPAGITVDEDDNLYVADFNNNRIRKITTDAYVSTIAGTGSLGNSDGPALAASFRKPYGLAFDSEGNLFISDSANHRIRKLDGDGDVSTFAGSGSGFKDGYGIFAKFNTPMGLVVDRNDNLYVADYGNNRIRVIAPDGLVINFAGSGANSFLDADAKYAQFNGPVGLSIDEDSNIFVSDSINNKIRKINSAGSVITLAGLGGSGIQDGLAKDALFDTPLGIHVIGNSVLVCDSANNLIRKIYKSADFAKEVLGFASVSDEPVDDQNNNQEEQVVQETNTRPVIKVASDLSFGSIDRAIPTYTLGADLELQIFTFDLEDRDAISDSISWQSNAQGFLAEGSSFNIKNLRLGTHHITVTARDSGSLTSSTEFDIRIIPFTASKPNADTSVNSGNSGESSAFTKTMILKITTDENKLFTSKQTRLNAVGFDLQSGTPEDISSRIAWSSSIDGEIGRGAEIKAKLSQGTHSITATIGENSDSINIVVAARAKKKKRSAKILPKPKSVEQIDMPEINMEAPQPRDREAVGKEKSNSEGGDAIGVKDVRIKLL